MAGVSKIPPEAQVLSVQRMVVYIMTPETKLVVPSTAGRQRTLILHNWTVADLF